MLTSYFIVSIPRIWDSVPAGEQVWLQVVVECANSMPCPVIIPPIRHKKRDLVDVDESMVPKDLQLLPGEVCVITVGLRFRCAGMSNLNDILIEVNPVCRSIDFDNHLLEIPSNLFRVLPSLAKEISFTVSRICQYGSAVKVELEVVHCGTSDLSGVEWKVGPADRIRSGVTHRRLAGMKQDDKYRYEMVLTGKEIEIEASAICQGERVACQQLLTIPDSSQIAEESRQFKFLEPRNFTADTITIKPEKEAKEVLSSGGVFPVFGGKSRYEVIILPRNPDALGVKLLPVAGQVEVSTLARDGRSSAFVITVVENPVLRQTVRLDYIMTVNGHPLQGEIYLSIRPTNSKLWLVSMTAGFALTARGVVAVGPALFRLDDSGNNILEHVAELFEKRWTDLIQLTCVPIIRAGLWVVDFVMRQFDDV